MLFGMLFVGMLFKEQSNYSTLVARLYQIETQSLYSQINSEGYVRCSTGFGTTHLREYVGFYH